MQRRRELLGMQQNVPPSGYRFIAYARAEAGHVILPFGFDKTDEMITKASCGYSGRDKFIIAPRTWNDNHNRFAFVGGPYEDNFGIGYGDISTANSACFWPKSAIRRDNDFHVWEYKDYRFSIDDISPKLDVSTITFAQETDDLLMFYGYSTNTPGKIAYYRHKKANGTTYNIVPIQHKTTGVVEMYDTVSKTIMPRTGTLYPPEE